MPTTCAYTTMVATLEANMTDKQQKDTPSEQNKDHPDDDLPLYKTAHNNPKKQQLMLRTS